MSKNDAGKPKTAQPGWYDFAGGKRFFDGKQWTDHYAYTPEPALDFWEIVGAVCLGVVGAFVLLWIAAQVAPDLFYLPVKFVVEANDLPDGF